MGGSGHAMDMNRRLKESRAQLKAKREKRLKQIEGNPFHYTNEKLIDKHADQLSQKQKLKSIIKSRLKAKDEQDIAIIKFVLILLGVGILFLFAFRDNIFY